MKKVKATPKKKPEKKPKKATKPKRPIGIMPPPITYVPPVPPKPPVPETCLDCRFSYIIGGQHDLVCRRFPPMSFTGAEYASWPVVKLTDWCGEFK